MTFFNKRLERLKAMLPTPPRDMTFVYEDGERVEVVGFLAAVKQNHKRGGLVDVLGADEGLKNFLFCTQCDIEKLFSEEGAKSDGTSEHLFQEVEAAQNQEGDQRPDAGGAVRPVKELHGSVRKRRAFPIRRHRRGNR